MENAKVSDKVTEFVGYNWRKTRALHINEKIEAPHVQAYIHPGNRLATLVGFQKRASISRFTRMFAMQIAAMNLLQSIKMMFQPVLLHRKIEIGKEQANVKGKPEENL